jgi:predicted aspartyl protease
MKAVSIRGGILALALVSATAGGARAAETQCRIVHMVDVDMGSDEIGRVIVPMNVSGKTVHLLVDTGGVVSMLKKSVVSGLGLQSNLMAYDRYLVMFGGRHIDHIATAYDIDFGGLKANSMRFAVVPDDAVGNGMDGTLAPDILSAYDAEFDFANNKFYLNSQDHCPGRVVYWTSSPYAIIPMWINPDGHVNISVDLDGKQITALIDTGSTRSIMSFNEAQSEFGLKDNSPGLKRKGDDNSGYSYSYPFKTLSLNGITINNPDLILVPESESHVEDSGGAKIIMGMGILRQLHLYIAYGEAKIYATGASAH